jgi:hypothetical protein
LTSAKKSASQRSARGKRRIHHRGTSSLAARSNLSDATDKRDWQISRHFANALIVRMRLHVNGAFASEHYSAQRGANAKSRRLSAFTFHQKTPQRRGLAPYNLQVLRLSKEPQSIDC